MNKTDIQKLVTELLTCGVCQYIGFKDGRPLHLFPNCQHYLCEVCIDNLREKECPFCREPFDTNNIPIFRYSQDLAGYVLNSRSKDNIGSQHSRKEEMQHEKYRCVKEIDMTTEQIVSFMCFGKDRDIITSAGALSHQFGNTGLYLLRPGMEEVIWFGDPRSRYDGVSYSQDYLVTVNRTKHRVEVFHYAVQTKRPAYCALSSLESSAVQWPEDLEVSISSYIDSKQVLHAFLPGYEYTYALNKTYCSCCKNKMKKTSNNVPVLSTAKELWRVNGEVLVMCNREGKEQNKVATLANLDALHPFGQKQMLYTIKGSSTVFVLDLSSAIRRNASPNSFTKPYACVTLEKKHDVLKIAGSADGFVAVLFTGSEKKLLRLYSSHAAGVEKMNTASLKGVNMTCSTVDQKPETQGSAQLTDFIFPLVLTCIFRYYIPNGIQYLRCNHGIHLGTLWSLSDETVAWILSLCFLLFGFL